MLERQVEYTLKALQALDAKGAAALVPTEAAQAAFNKTLQEQLSRTVWADPACNSWYKTGTGKITQNWGGHTRSYAEAVAEVNLEDYELV